jgi:DNA helicase II / ATP-dependent DNA helicase PcrA
MAVKLTDEQLKAIAHAQGNLQLIACAGSGKTEVVARRVAHLLKSAPNTMLPRNIVAFTFTEKAAAELKERIVHRCRQELGEVWGFAEMFVGTIHAFALELLKTEAPKYLQYEVLNEVQQDLFVNRHSKASGLTACTDLQGNTLRRYLDTDRYVSALSILREAEIDTRALRGCSIVAGLSAYRSLLAKKGYFDYSSLMEAAVEVLQSDPEVRARVRERVRHVIVDEYQDVNPIQETLISLLHGLGASLCVVGDDDQTIYQWRGSDVNNILSFADRYAGVSKVRLEDNFRSSRGVVEVSRSFVEQNAERLTKAMKPAGTQADEPGDIVGLEFGSPEQEAKYIAETILASRGLALKDGDAQRGISWSDMAILLRSVKGNGGPIASALTEAGIPYIVVGMNNLFETREALAARELFYFMDGRTDEPALLAAWQSTGTGSSDRQLRVAIRSAASSRAAMAAEDGARWSFYSLQRQFLRFLEEAGIREERVPRGRGEVLFYNLGKFSQLISDFEAIHYHARPKDKYSTFAGFLQYQAEYLYPEGWQENQYANPDAVRIMTVHQAKGMQWPVVFAPALLKNRFPSKKQGGRTVWHLLPAASVKGQARYEGSIEDERRLFYVLMTRSQKFLHLTWAPVGGNRLYQRPSVFWDDLQAFRWVRRRPPDYSGRQRLPPTPKAGLANVVLSFSDLKYFFECPYQFKLRILYGFNAPIHEALGYGKSLHDALAEIHARVSRGGGVPELAEVPELVQRHLRTPYAYPKLREELTRAAESVVADYLHDNRGELPKIEFFEKPVAVNMGDGISVVGRIDLVRRLDTRETTIVDLKSNQRTQQENVNEVQLHIYALGYEELTGRRADYVEVYDLEGRKKKPRPIDDTFMVDVRNQIRSAATALRSGSMPPEPTPKKCANCDYCGMCSNGTSVAPKVSEGRA